MTEFTKWRSLVDGERIRAIPDSDLYYDITEDSVDESNNIVQDVIGDNNAESVGDISLTEDSSVGHGFFVNLDADNHLEVENNPISIDDPFSVGAEIVVDNPVDDGTVSQWSDGNKIIRMAISDEVIWIAYWDGSSWADVASHSEPSTPYNIDLFGTWNPDGESVELYLNESPSTGSDRPRSSTAEENFSIGGEFGDRGLDEGVARFAYWGEIVDASEFTI